MFDFEFPPDADVKDERPTVPEGTQAWVKIRLEKDGTLALKSGTSAKTNKPWVSVPLIVDGGEFDGRWCSLMMTPDPNNRFFRADYQVITGIDLEAGGKADGAAFDSALRSGRFFAEIASRGDFVNVKKMLKREDVEAVASPTIGGATAVTSPEVGEDDIPF